MAPAQSENNKVSPRPPRAKTYLKISFTCSKVHLKQFLPRFSKNISLCPHMSANSSYPLLKISFFFPGISICFCKMPFSPPWRGGGGSKIQRFSDSPSVTPNFLFYLGLHACCNKKPGPRCNGWLSL